MICKDCKPVFLLPDDPRRISANIDMRHFAHIELCEKHDGVEDSQQKAERRRYALLQAAVTIYAEGDLHWTRAECIIAAECLLADIERREKGDSAIDPYMKAAHKLAAKEQARRKNKL
jgi:hypothetical protein